MTIDKIFRGVLNERTNRINNDAEIKRNVVSYLGNFIKSNREELTGAFLEDINKSFENNMRYMKQDIELRGYDIAKSEFFEDTLYNKVESMIKGLSNPPMGLTIYSKEVQSPDVVLGFSSYSKENTRTKSLTKKGIEEVNNYRKAAGKISIEKSIELKKKRRDAAHS